MKLTMHKEKSLKNVAPPFDWVKERRASPIREWDTCKLFFI